jgi:hypothetical protein
VNSAASPQPRRPQPHGAPGAQSYPKPTTGLVEGRLATERRAVGCRRNSPRTNHARSVSSGSRRASRSPRRHVAGSPYRLPPSGGGRARTERPRSVPRSSDVESRQGTTVTNQQVTRIGRTITADPSVRLRKSDFFAVCDLSRSRATSSHTIAPTSIATASSNHRRYLVAPSRCSAASGS